MAVSWVEAIRRIARRVQSSEYVHPRTQEDRNARLLYLNTASIGVASGGIAAFLAVFLARLGASTALLSWLSSAPALLALLCLIPGAMVAERHTDQVKLRARAAYGVYLAYLLCALAPFVVPSAHLPIVLVLIWTVKTVGESVTIPSWLAVMLRAIPPRRRPQVNGMRWALTSLISALSSVSFGWLLDHVAFPLNYQIVFLISFVTSLGDPFFFAHIRVPPLEALDPGRAQGLMDRVREYTLPVLRYRPFVIFLAATIGYRVALNLPAPLFSVFWVNDLHATDTLIGLRGTLGNGALVAGYMLWGRSANRLGHRKVLTIAALGLALYPIMTALSPTGVWLLPTAVIWGLTASGVDIGLFDLMLASCPEQRQPLFAAFWSMAANLAVFVGPLLGAALSGATSIAVALIVAGAAQILMTIPFAALSKDV